MVGVVPRYYQQASFVFTDYDQGGNVIISKPLAFDNIVPRGHTFRFQIKLHAVFICYQKINTP